VKPGIRELRETKFFFETEISDHSLPEEVEMNIEITRAPAEQARVGRSGSLWALLVTGVAIFMVSLDNLVVTTALPAIRAGLGAGLEGLEWTVNAYTLTFAVFLLTGAALGDRFGRRRMLLIGLSLFTLASAAAAVAPDIGTLIAARAVQGVGAAIVAPLTLTLLSAAVPATKRGLALGAWGAMSGLAVALGPVIGGAIVDYASWQWIFWVNVPIGVALIPVARRRLAESYGPTGRLDLAGTVLASAGLLGVVLGLVRGNRLGWTSPEILISFAAGAILLAGFVAWELRSAAPMLPMRFFRSRSFSAANVASLLMFFGMFGSIFLLAQFLQTVQGYSPFAAGVRTLPWTGMPLIAAPLAGALTDRIGSRPIVTVGLALQAIGLGWLAMVSAPDVAYSTLVPAFVVSGLGMGMFFAPIANLVLGAVSSAEEGMASGANNAIREVGGVLGVAVLAAVFSKTGGYTSGQAFVDGLIPAVWVGAVAVAGAVVAAVLVPRRSRVVADVSALPGQAVREPVAA
jgi:EmrB/QacA subfamily drug resistance transporter